ncbi:hypothetical protein B0G80_4187 [Paraburkholderia sp. BL6669N2]|nr:hypothetical protein B0G80_4187 [Paraburkholderia sp. BL6669N2]
METYLFCNHPRTSFPRVVWQGQIGNIPIFIHHHINLSASHFYSSKLIKTVFIFAVPFFAI